MGRNVIQFHSSRCQLLLIIFILTFSAYSQRGFEGFSFHTYAENSLHDIIADYAFPSIKSIAIKDLPILSDSTRIELISLIDIPENGMGELIKKSFLTEEYFSLSHLRAVDFTGDGKMDIIGIAYGPPAGDGLTHFALWEQINGRYRYIGVIDGEDFPLYYLYPYIEKIIKTPDSIHNFLSFIVSFSAFDSDEYFSHYELYKEEGNLKLRLADKYFIRIHQEYNVGQQIQLTRIIPNRIQVNVEACELASSPDMSNMETEIYRFGDLGIALGKVVDNNENVFWFVVMDALDGLIKNSGWMHSDDLKILNTNFDKE